MRLPSLWRAAVARLRARLLADWLNVLGRSWSVRASTAAAGLLTLAYVWPTGLSFLPEWFGLVPVALVVASVVLRVVAQRGLSLPHRPKRSK